MKRLKSYLYFFYFIIVYVVTCFLIAPYIFFFVRGDKKYKRAKKVKKYWAKSILFAVGIKIKKTGLKNVESDKNYIICPNHKSYLDILLMYLIIDHDFAFLGKSEILKYPVIRFFFKRGIDIPVYRGTRIKAAQCLELAKKEIKTGRSVVVFPEGGWDNSETEMRKFKNGAFKLAIDTGCAILPITFKNNYDIFTDLTDLKGNSKPGIADVVVHKPILTKSLEKKDLVSLKNKTFNVINKELKSDNR